MRKLLIAVGLFLSLTAGAAQAQFCPGAAPYVFTDVPANDGFCGFITWMAQTGITTGCQIIDANNRRYCPDDFVTRKQMSAFMSRLGRDVAFAEGGNAFGTLPNNTAVLGTADANALDIRVNGARVMRYERTSGFDPNVIGGSATNAVAPEVGGAVIGGGGGSGSTYENLVFSGFGTVAGGVANRAGDPNNVLNQGATVGGGMFNAASGYAAVVAGGANNLAAGFSSAVAGGNSNAATGTHSAIPGGLDNVAAGVLSFAAGRNARANFAGCFVYADASHDEPTSCFANNEIVIRGIGGFYFWTTGDNDNNYSGARLAPGAGAWAAYSDVHGKEALEPVNSAEILERLLAMPVARWQWKAEPGNVKHIGPTAQDFRIAFGLGDSDKQIVTVDADGVAMAAIQGLNAKLEDREAVLRREAQARDVEIAALKRELADLRAIHQKEMADLRLAVEVLMAQTSTEGRVAQTR